MTPRNQFISALDRKPPQGQVFKHINCQALKAVYEAAGAPENWRLSRYRTGHQETAAMRQEILDYLEQKL